MVILNLGDLRIKSTGLLCVCVVLFFEIGYL